VTLRARLALSYATTIFVAGVVVLGVVVLPFVGVQSIGPDREVTGTGEGIGPGQLLVGSVVALVGLVPVAALGGWFVAGRFLRPLRTITTTAAAISAGNLHRRLDLGDPVDELSELGRILDDLFARLEAAFDAQRHFVANASHELRTPLAGLRTLLEVTLADPDADVATLRSACEDALALGVHQERLVQALLALAEGERGPTRRDPVNLADIVRDALAARRDDGPTVTGHLAPASTTGDPGLIGSLVTNLIDNAVRHNRPDGHVQVSTGPGARITVANTGPVVPSDQLGRLFQPFQRLAPERGGRQSGYGLGLAIVDAVARAHRATLTATANPLGGLTVTVEFVPVQTVSASPSSSRR
jgi:signal transduction histidine kinase